MLLPKRPGVREKKESSSAIYELGDKSITTYHETVLSVRVLQSKLVVVDDRGVEGLDRSVWIGFWSVVVVTVIPVLTFKIDVLLVLVVIGCVRTYNFSARLALSIHCTPANLMLSSLAWATPVSLRHFWISCSKT